MGTSCGKGGNASKKQKSYSSYGVDGAKEPNIHSFQALFLKSASQQRIPKVQVNESLLFESQIHRSTDPAPTEKVASRRAWWKLEAAVPSRLQASVLNRS